MNQRPSEQQPLTPLNVTVVLVITTTLFGVLFFTSPPPDILPDGALQWSEGSLLKALTAALAFNFSIPTPQGFEVKDLVAAIGSSLALIVAAIGAVAARRAREREFSFPDPETEPSRPGAWRGQIDPLLGAQLLLVLFATLSFLSLLWSPMPDLAAGGSVVLLTAVAWAFGIRIGLNARGVRAAAVLLMVLLTTAAALALWYYFERNRTMRVGYPIGNPLFFAACMIPVVLLSLCWTASAVRDAAAGTRTAWLRIPLCLVSLATVLWAVSKADPRSTYAGLGAGVVAVSFFAVRGIRLKLVALVLASVVAGSAALYFLVPRFAARGETIRTRLHAWNYAEQLIADSPVIGHGQGAFALLGDGLAVQDVVSDPRALHARLTHAHNEWLEVAVDLGSLGLVMILSCFGLTLLAGVRALRGMSSSGQRWLLIGLMASLVGIMVEECFDVALRVAGLPTVFYAVLGLTWALIASATRTPGPAAPPTRGQMLAAGAAALCGLAILISGLLDFRAARALYSFQERLAGRQWEPALEEVQTAMRFRLDPARRLAAIYSRAWCHARIGREFLSDYVGRLKQMGDAPAEGAQASILRSYVQRIEQEAEAALSQIERLTRGGSRYIGAYLIAAEAYQMLWNCAVLAGQAERAGVLKRSAVEALYEELRRQPFNADVVWGLLESVPDLPLSAQVELICRPMQYHAIDQRFFERVMALSTAANFDEEFRAILLPALAHAATGSGGGDTPDCAAQKLRMAAWVSAGRGDFAKAVDMARASLQLAEQEQERFPIAFAVAHRELAHYLFLADPSDLQTPMAACERGKALLPFSHESAALRQRFDQRLAQYHLAQGDEQTAVRLMPGAQALKTPALQAELAGLYFSFCQLILTLPDERWPSYLSRLLDRLDELVQDSPVPATTRSAVSLMRAQVSYEKGDLQRCIALWREACTRGGADPEAILRLAEGASREHPDSEVLRQFIGYLSAVLAGPR